MSNPYGMPPTPPKKSRTGLYIGLACGCLALVALLIAVIGGGLWFLGQSGGTEDPTSGPTTSEEPTEDPTDDPTDDPIDEPTEDPTTEESGMTLSSSTPRTASTFDFEGDEKKPQLDTFIILELTITNNLDDTIDLADADFAFYDTSGNDVHVSYVTAPQKEIRPGDSVPVTLVGDAESGVTVAEVEMTDPVGTGGNPVKIPAGS